MKVLNSLFIIMLALGVNGCAKPVDLEAEAAAIRQLTDVNWLEAGKTRDLDRWMSHYTDDTIFFPPGGAPVVGKKAMQSHRALRKENGSSLNVYMPSQDRLWISKQISPRLDMQTMGLGENS